MARGLKQHVVVILLFSIPFSIGILAYWEPTKHWFSWGWGLAAMLAGLLSAGFLMLEVVIVAGLCGARAARYLATTRTASPSRARQYSLAATFVLAAGLCFWAPHLPPRPAQPEHPPGSSCNSIWVLADYHGRCRLKRIPDPNNGQRWLLLGVGTLLLSFACGAVVWSVTRSSAHETS